MRILLLNPNISQSITDRLLTVARATAAPGTSFTPVTAPRGVSYISCRAEAQVAGAIVLEMLAEHARGHDVALIAAFCDPRLRAARELFDLPVVGMAEAAIHSAAILGERFSIVTFSPALSYWFRDCVRDCGLSLRLAAIRSLDTPLGPISAIAEENEEALARLCEATAIEDGADIVILAGAPLAGLADRIAHRVSVPLVEQVAAGVVQAQTLARLGAPHCSNLRRQVPKASQGLPAALAARLAHTDLPDRAKDEAHV